MVVVAVVAVVVIVMVLQGSASTVAYRRTPR